MDTWELIKGRNSVITRSAQQLAGRARNGYYLTQMRMKFVLRGLIHFLSEFLTTAWYNQHRQFETLNIKNLFGG